MKIAGVEKTSPVKDGAVAVDFEMKLPAGDTTVETFLTDVKGKTGGAYFTYVEYLGE